MIKYDVCPWDKVKNKSKSKSNTSPLEHDECIALVAYLDILMKQGKVIAYTHIPQETYTKNFGTMMRNKREGVKKGIPDYLIIFKNHKILFLEIKRVKGGNVSPEQKDWIEKLAGKTTYSGVAKGFEAAKIIIDAMT
jgi:hypothetical protein